MDEDFIKKQVKEEIETHIKELIRASVRQQLKMGKRVDLIKRVMNQWDLSVDGFLNEFEEKFSVLIIEEKHETKKAVTKKKKRGRPAKKKVEEK